MAHAQWWVNVFNLESSYVHPRSSDGTWPWPLDPAGNTGFLEGNAAQYTWMIPYNYASLANMMGGVPTAIQRLDLYFSQLKAGFLHPYFYIGNENGHNEPWAYNFLGAPWATQSTVRRIMAQTFSTGPGGLPGQDDLGATSAWYVWAALGLFPVTPGTDTLAIHGPLFSSATIQLAGGSVLQINAVGAAAASPYVQDLRVNGAPSTSTWLHYGEIAGGATLDFTMGSQPNKSWGTNPADAPPSFEDGFAPPPSPPTLGTNLALNKTATADSSCTASENSSKAVDATLLNDSKWCSQGSSKWLQVDLGASHVVTNFVVKHAGIGGETTAWNTRDYEILLSPDGLNSTTPVISVSGNRSSRTAHAISPTSARYVRLNVAAPTNDGSGMARIYELEVYGRESRTGDLYLPLITR